MSVVVTLRVTIVLMRSVTATLSGQGEHDVNTF